ncbi:MAG: AtpZ/AtpI family protein [Alphaproteobacteria bacterium]|nr:AtpZ/AtpI family protein [Alphaproteobacteria bacterium]
MVEDPEKDRLDAMADQIRKAEEQAGIRQKPPEPEEEGTSRATMTASRIGVDFAVTVVVCIGLGWLIDAGLGTKPWGILIMLLLGFVTGATNVWRALNGFDQAGSWRSPKSGKTGEKED